jgi:EpsI family protein
MKRLFSSKNTLVIAVLLLIQVGIYYAYPKTEVVPVARPLAEVSTVIGPWRLERDIPLETDVENLLQSDDSLNRFYVSDQGRTPVSLFVAYYKTQRTGISPHSPKVCLPGNGWTSSREDHILLQVPGRADPIQVNHSVVSRGENKSVVLYWYQTSRRIIADEYQAKIYTVLDGLRYRRTDTSIVRVIAPALNGDVQAAEKTAAEFVQLVFPSLMSHFPAQ